MSRPSNSRKQAEALAGGKGEADDDEGRRSARPDALGLALSALATKERSVAELGDWLRKRGVGKTEAEDAVAELVAAGTLDDARFAARYAEDKRELAGWGSERIRAALLERGVPHHEVEAALAGEDEPAEAQRAAALLRERGADLGDERARGKALGLLARRGYSSDVAYEAVRLAERSG